MAVRNELELIQDILDEYKEFAAINGRSFFLFKNLESIKKTKYSDDARANIGRIIKRRDIFETRGKDGFMLSEKGEIIANDFRWNYLEYLKSFRPSETTRPKIQKEKGYEREVIQLVLDEYRDRGVPRGYSLFFLNFEDLNYIKKSSFSDEIKKDIANVILRCDIFKKFDNRGFTLSEKGEILRDVYNWNYNAYDNAHLDFDSNSRSIDSNNKSERKTEEAANTAKVLSSEEFFSLVDRLSSLSSNIYLARFIWDNGSQLERFIQQGIWESENLELDLHIINNAQVGNVIFLGDIGNSAGRMEFQLRGYGILVSKTEDQFLLKVNWRLFGEPISVSNTAIELESFARLEPALLVDIWQAVTKRVPILYEIIASFILTVKNAPVTDPPKYWWYSHDMEDWRLRDVDKNSDILLSQFSKNKGQRQIAENFKKVQLGDYTLGFDKKVNEVISILKVNAVPGNLPQENLRFEVFDGLADFIPWSNISNLDVLQDSQLLQNPNADLVELTKKEFEAILRSVGYDTYRLIGFEPEDNTENPIESTRIYKFPKFELDEVQLQWLENIYEKFNKNEDFEIRNILAKKWTIFKDFKPESIPKILVEGGGKEITLFGISQIEPEHSIFKKFDQFMYAVRDHLRSGDNITKVESSALRALLPADISESELFHIAKLLRHFRTFTNGWGHNGPGGAFHITVSSDDAYRGFLNYEGLAKLIQDTLDNFLQSNENVNIATNEITSILSDKLGNDAFDPERKKIILHDPNDIEGVLNVEKVADETWKLIRDLPDEKGIFGIFGSWGRGKSFFIKKIIKKMADDSEAKKYKVLEFDAWQYQDTPAIWAYLFQTIAEEFKKSSEYWPFGWKLINKSIFTLNVKKYGLSRILIFTFFSLILPVVLLLIPFKEKVELFIGIYSMIGIGGFIFAYRFFNSYLPKAKDLFRKYSKLTTYKHLLGIQAEIQVEIIQLITHWIKEPKNERLLLVIENLDRCDENKMLPLIDALRIILEKDEIADRVTIVAAVDENLMSSCVKIKFRNFIGPNKAKSKNEELFVAEYLDKIFISGIRLNPLTGLDNGEIVLALAENDLRSKGVTIDHIRTELKNKEKSRQTENEARHKSEQMTAPETNYSSAAEKEKRTSIIDNERTQPEEIDDENENAENVEQKTETQDRSTPQLGFSIDEIGLIYSCAKRHRGLTPRKIRIIYYRYYLAKNLFVGLYENPNENLWRNKDYSKLLVELIFRHSLDRKGLDSLDHSKWSENNPPMIPYLGSEIQIPYSDYIKMLTVLRMVIVF